MPPLQNIPAAPTALPEHVSVGSFIKHGWETFKKRPWFFVGSLLLFGLASGVIGGFANVVQVMVDGAAKSGLGHLLGWLISQVGNVFVGIGSLSFFIKA